jgi:hypothetical protein
MRALTWRQTVSGCVLIGLVTGCGASGKTPGPIVLAPQQPTPAAPAGQPAVIDPALRPIVAAAVIDLARRLNIDQGSITVLEGRAVVWPDGSLGCPRPGMVYPQVQQDGALIRLSAQGREFRYHSGGSRPVFLCENPA